MVVHPSAEGYHGSVTMNARETIHPAYLLITAMVLGTSLSDAFDRDNAP